jgi:flagellar protein FliS
MIFMNPQGAQSYLRTKVLTATPEQLQLMLFDGAIRFGEQARAALEQKNWERSFTLIARIQMIINELRSSLKPDIDPDLCKKLSALYGFAYRQLIDASIQHNVNSLDEALNVLKYQRETWAMLMAQIGKQKAAAAAKNIDIPAPNSRMEASISMQG